MKLNIKFSFFLVFISLLCPSLKANDSIATVVGGAIQYTKSSDISMDSEVLRISTEQINISYEFTNHNSQEITSQVVFPLPKSPFLLGDKSLIFPSWDDFFNAYNFIDQTIQTIKLPPDPLYNNNRSLRNSVKYAAFSDFRRTVNGVEQSYVFEPRAIHVDGRDITSQLVEHDIPLSAAFIAGFMGEGGLIYRDPKLEQKLKKLGLVNDRGNLQWQLQINYIWNQTFPPQKTIYVTHSYRPHPGQHWLSSKISGSFKNIELYHRDKIKLDQPEIKEIKHYCPTQSDILAIEAMFTPEKASKKEYDTINSNMSYEIQEVRYILTTGANWKGPIKKFRLEIVPPSPSTVVLTCFPKQIQKNEQGIYVAELESFTPEADLKILFIDPSK